MVNIDEKNVISYNVDLNTTTLDEICKDNTFLKTNFKKHAENFSYYYNMFLGKFDSYLAGFKKLIQLDFGEVAKIPTKDIDENDPRRLELVKADVTYWITPNSQPSAFSNVWFLNDRKSKFGFLFLNNSFCILEKSSENATSYTAIKIDKLSDMEALASVLLNIDMHFEFQAMTDEIKRAISDKNKDFTIHSNELLKLANEMKTFVAS